MKPGRTRQHPQRASNFMAFILALLVFGAGLAAAQDTDQGKKATGPPSVPTMGTQDDVLGDPLSTNIPCDRLEDKEAKSTCWQALRKRFEYYKWGLDQRQKVIAWQYRSSRIIFVFVLLIVNVGLYFSWLQFRMYLRGGAAPASPEAKTGRHALDSNIELGASGLKVNSNVLGVIILALSLGFLYLYLAHVYPISEIF